jgi:carboxyl-terminal processing protease
MVFVLYLAYLTGCATESVQGERLVFSEVLSEVEQKCVAKKIDDDLTHKALECIVSSLDSHAAYLTLDEYNDLQREAKGNSLGVGLEITLKDGFPTVVSPIEGLPADRAGVRAGDRIIKIDGKPTKGMSAMHAVKMVRGPKETKVTLSILRQGVANPLDFSITRGFFPLRSVRYNLMESGYGYVRIANFQEDIANDLIKALQVLQGQKVPLKGLVLDLRNSPGGLFIEAIKVADQFLQEGVIVSAKGRLPNRQIVVKASKNATAFSYPVIVLVNHGSAAASEIVAGALQDNKRALVLGTRTFGHGSIQTLIPLKQKGALRLTTGYYYTPEGRPIQDLGIEPDIVLSFDSLEKNKSIGNETAGAAVDSGGNDDLYMSANRLARDSQLSKAVEILKTTPFPTSVAK